MSTSRALILNKIVIESRADMFINATQMCKAGNRRFNNWYQLDSTTELIAALENDLNSNTGIPVLKTIDITRGKYGGSWIHPDLAVQLAQWISPSFAIQVSRWIRELFTTGEVKIDSRKSDEELKELQSQLKLKDAVIAEKDTIIAGNTLMLEEKEDQLNRLHNIQKELLSYKKRVTKDETIYIVSTANYSRQGIYGRPNKTTNEVSLIKP